MGSERRLQCGAARWAGRAACDHVDGGSRPRSWPGRSSPRGPAPPPWPAADRALSAAGRGKVSALLPPASSGAGSPASSGAVASGEGSDTGVLAVSTGKETMCYVPPTRRRIARWRTARPSAASVKHNGLRGGSRRGPRPTGQQTERRSRREWGSSAAPDAGHPSSQHELGLLGNVQDVALDGPPGGVAPMPLAECHEAGASPGARLLLPAERVGRRPAVMVHVGWT